MASHSHRSKVVLSGRSCGFGFCFFVEVLAEVVGTNLARHKGVRHICRALARTLLTCAPATSIVGVEDVGIYCKPQAVAGSDSNFFFVSSPHGLCLQLVVLPLSSEVLLEAGLLIL